MGARDHGPLLAAALFGLVNCCVGIGFFAGPSTLGKWLVSPTDNFATLIGSGAVLLGLLVTARQWSNDNQSKREEARSRRHAEYAERIAAFHTLQTRSAVMMVLNYDRDIVLRDGEPLVRVSWQHCEVALIPAPFRQYLYEPHLIAIRDCFNDLIENMSRLDYLQGQKLVDTKDVDHLCKSILVRFAGANQFAETPFARNFRLYVQWRKAGRVLGLFRRYACDITLRKTADIAALRADIDQGRYGACTPSSWGEL